MSLRIYLLITFVLVPVIARRGGGGHTHGHGGGGYGGGHTSHTSHTYPASNGFSGNSGFGGQAATYPHSTGISGNNHATQHNYGNNYQNNHNTLNNNYQNTHNNYGNNYQSTHHTTNVHKTEIHHHYSPPQHISYGSGYHPVFYGQPPVYVYTYRDSGSRFDTLLTGLALYNLGRMSGHHDNHYYNPQREYRGTPGEVCKLQITKTNGEFEETRIDCRLMSSYIWEAEQERNRVTNTVNSNTVTTVNKTTTVEQTSAGNGTTVTNTTTTVVEAVNVKGPSLEVTPGMNCYMIHISQYSSILKKKVECGLLQAYARDSFRNEAWRIKPTVVLVTLVTTMLIYLI